MELKPHSTANSTPYSGKNHQSLSVFCFARETASAGKGYNPSGLCSDKTVREP